MKHILFVGFHWTEAFYLWYLSHLTSSGERNTGFLVKQRSQYSTLCDEPKMLGTHCSIVWYQSPNRRQDNEKGDHYKEAPGAGPEDVGPPVPSDASSAPTCTPSSFGSRHCRVFEYPPFYWATACKKCCQKPGE